MSKKLTFWEKIILWIVWVYMLILFVWWFLSNCIIWREETTLWQCTSNQLNMALTLWINKRIEIQQNRAEHRAEVLQNKIEKLSTLSWVISNTWWTLMIDTNVTFESW